MVPVREKVGKRLNKLDRILDVLRVCSITWIVYEASDLGVGVQIPTDPFFMSIPALPQ